MASIDRSREADEDPAAALMRLDPEGRLLDQVGASQLAEEREEDHRRLTRARRAYARARNRFMCAYLRLVVSIAKRLGRKHMPLSDRIQEGNLGLIRAIDRFDPERGCRFSTYAAWWIRHAVICALVKYGRTVRIPAHLHALFRRAQRVRSRLHGRLGREPTLAEIADGVGETPARVEAAIHAMELRSVRLVHPAPRKEGREITERIADEGHEGWTDRIADRIDCRLAAAAIEMLDATEYDIVVQRFGLCGHEPRTLRSLGEDYSLSRERIRQLQNLALQHLRSAMEHSRVSSLEC